MKNFQDFVRPYLRVLGGLCLLVAFPAAFWAYFNLLGVPMLEKSAMDPAQGWTSLVIAIFSTSCAA